MSSSKPQQVPMTTTVNRDPWSGQQPHLTEGMTRARTLLDTPLQFYPNSTVVPFAPQTEQALGRAESRAATGSPLVDVGQDEFGRTIRGEYLAPGNPYLDQAISSAVRPMVREYMGAVAPGLDARFSKAGRYGSGMHAFSQQGAQEALARGIGDVASGMGYQNYLAERNRMLQAAQQAPAMAAADYADIGKLEQVGRTREAQGGAELQERIARFMFPQQAPRDALAQYMALVGGGQFGGSETTTSMQPIFRNPWGEGLGAGALGVGMLGTLFGQGGIWPQ